MTSRVNHNRSTAASRIMLITNQLHASPSGGRDLLCKLNHDALKAIFDDRLVVFELPHHRLKGLRSVLNAFRGHIDGLNESTMAKALQVIQSQNVGKVFVDGSNLGSFVKLVKRKFPQTNVSTFFHNVESRFFLGSLRRNKTLHALAVLAVNYLAERKSVKYSDKIICLSERDSRLLQKVYGRSATHISPMAMQDKRPVAFAENFTPPSEKFSLFVGGNFYANQAGIAWFVEHVVPRISIKTYIVGHGFEDLRLELERVGKVEIIGSVNSLANWYLNAQFVIAPIFDGSGMKTKVTEALMYGKKIVGSPEAFSGYEDIADRAGWVCETADEFVAAIGRAQQKVVKAFDPELRALYEKNYSFPAARARLAVILDAGTSI